MWTDDGEQKIRQRTLGRNCPTSTKNEIISRIKDKYYKRDIRFNFRKDILPLKDVVIDLITLEFRKASHLDYLTYTLPVFFDPDAVSKYIVPFIEKTVTDEDERWNLYAMIGYCFLRSTPYKAIFWLLGETNTGKSTFLEVLGPFFGKLVSSVSVYDFDKAEYLETLRDKMINIEDEVSGISLNPAVVNSLKWGSGTEISKQGKKMYLNPREIEVKPKMVMAANEYAPPKYPDEAYSKRCVFIRFKHQFELTNKDNIVEKMTSKNELSALLNIALDHLRELNERGSFKPTEHPPIKGIPKNNNGDPSIPTKANMDPKTVESLKKIMKIPKPELK